MEGIKKTTAIVVLAVLFVFLIGGILPIEPDYLSPIDISLVTNLPPDPWREFSHLKTEKRGDFPRPKSGLKTAEFFIPPSGSMNNSWGLIQI